MSLTTHYLGSQQRLFLIDYDGVLVDLAPTPEAATPPPAVHELLTGLAADPANTVVIVSGRDHHTLEEWLGSLPVAFSAEHGLYHRDAGGVWRATRALPQDWKAPVRRLMESAKLPGVRVEEKSMGLVWHYRQADPTDAARAAAALIKELHEYTSGLKIMPGNKIVEVTASGTDKGEAATYWLETGEYDFVLAAGDDTTDEDLFGALPGTAHKVKVGPPSPRANHTVPDPAAFHALLREFLAGT